MIKSITVTNHRGESLLLEMGFPEKSGFLIQEITGLGPTKANINTTEISGADGALYNTARITSRNIVLLLQLLEDPTVEDTRQKSYKYFPVKKLLRLRIETDNRICDIFGYVESNEPNIFSNQVTTQISIICPDPYFYSIEKVVTIFSSIEPLFEFPFSNESLTENLMNLGNIITYQERNVYYEGDSETGMVIYIHAFGEVTDLIIYNLYTSESMMIDTTKLETLTGNVIIAGDDIIISTIRGQKSIRLLRNGVYINILNCLDKDTDWFQLSKGDNVFAFVATTGSSKLQFKVESQTIYEGV